MTLDNPYDPHHPVQHAGMFCGRVDTLYEIGSFLMGNQSVALIGPAAIGKTSLLMHLLRTETIAALGLGKDNLLVSIDCQVLAASRQDEIFASFCASVAAALSRQGQEPEPALAAALVQLTRSGFELAVRRLNQHGLRVVLILDDFDALAQNPNVDLSFYNAMRSAAGRLRLAFLTASAQPLFDLTCADSSRQILSSPFFNIFAQLFLGLLPDAEARNLIRLPGEAAGRPVRQGLEDFIADLAGGHPLILQTACFYAWDSPDDLAGIERQTLQAFHKHFQREWESLSLVEQDALRHPAEASLHAGGNPVLETHLRDLTRKCLLVKVGKSYCYPSRAWAEFVAAQNVS